jgi:uncharacterized protein YkwD
MALPACSERQDAPVQPEPLGHVHGPDTSVLGAAPGQRGATGEAALANCGLRAAPEELLQRINGVRAAGHRCGRRNMGPAAPLKWDASLQSAATGHSLDMAKRNYFEHRSPEGADVASRASASNYRWQTVGENIAGGDRTVAEVMQGWLESPDHCENIMDPRFADVAVACVAQPGTEWGTYWTMVLGRKR